MSSQEMKMYLKSLIWSISGFVLVIGVLAILNQKKIIKKQDKLQSSTKFSIVEKKIKAVEKPQETVDKKNEDLAPDLDASLEGLSFGIPSLELDINAGSSLLNGVNDGVMTAQAVDILPKVLFRPPLEYPSKAASDGISGEVILNLLISELGQVEKVKVNKSTPQGFFEIAASKNVKKWKFEPAEYNGKKVAVWMNQTIEFNLE